MHIGATLLWVEIVLALLLTMAGLFAWTARWSSRAAQILVRTLAVLILLAPLVCLVVFSSWLVAMKIEHTGMLFSLPLALAALIGAVWLALLNRSRIAQWPAGRLAIGALLTFAVAGMTLWNIDVSSRLQLQVARSDAAALALSVAPPMVPDTQNAALLYAAAFDSLKNSPEQQGIWDQLEWSDKDRANPIDPERLAQGMDQLQEPLAQVLVATRLPYCRMEHLYSRPGFAIPQYSTQRNSANLLNFAARVAAHRGEVQRAVELADALYRLHEHAQSGPYLIGGLVAMGIGNTADETVLQILPAVTDARQLAPLHPTSPAVSRRSAQRALVSEEALGISLMAEMAGSPSSVEAIAGGRNNAGIMLGAVLSRLNSWPDEAEAYCRVMQLNQELVAMPPYQWKKSEEEHEREIDGLRRCGTLTSVFLPAIVKYARQTSSAEASRLMTQMAIAATRYRLEQGRNPAEAADLVPGYLPVLPKDPFDGQPLRMRSEEGGLLFYSIGTNRTDDNGREGKDGDHVLRLAAPH